MALFKDRGVRHTGVCSPEGPLFARSGALGSIVGGGGWSSKESFAWGSFFFQSPSLARSSLAERQVAQDFYIVEHR